MSNNMNAVDVLGVLDSQLSRLGNQANEHPNSRRASLRSELTEALAAVAELIEKANAILSHNPAHYDTDEEADLRAALARVHGAQP